MHYHVWLRNGRVFTMRPKRFDVRTTANKAAVKLRPNADERLVLACDDCPPTARSRRRPLRLSAIARAVGVPVERLRAAFEEERRRAREATSPDANAAPAAAAEAGPQPAAAPARDAGPDEARAILRQIRRATR